MVAKSNQLNIKTNNSRPTRQNAEFFYTKNIKTIVFCGSFKFYKDMEKAANPLREKGFTVIVPQPSHIRHAHLPQSLKIGKFSKKTLTRWEGEGAFQHLENIRKADLVYIFNKGSYLGPAVTVEIGFSLALKIPIFSKAPIKDITVTNFITGVVSPQKLLALLTKKDTIK